MFSAGVFVFQVNGPGAALLNPVNMESTKSKFLSHEEIGELRDRGEDLNPIDQLLWDYSPVEQEDVFRKQVFEAVNYEDPEWKTDRNANVVADFMEHCKENGVTIPDTLFESYFDA